AAALVLDAADLQALAALPGGYARWSRTVFLAKECVHKCVHPLRGAWLEFDEVRICLDAERGRFRVEALSARARAACAGCEEGVLKFTGDHVLAALAIGRH
ncbi:MAG TPA: 4'-phosphopantetheinyl transferase superfamily protein, partial [Burkholderiaceae bacterium]